MKTYKAQFESMGFGYDDSTATGYKKMNGFGFTVKVMPGTEEYMAAVYCSVRDDQMRIPLQKDLTGFASERKNSVKSAVFDGKKIIINRRIGVMADITKTLQEDINAMAYFINRYGCIPCCENCGKAVDTEIYALEGRIIPVCQDCLYGIQVMMAGKMQSDALKKTNYPLGIIGAVAGGLLGAGVWVLFSLMGYVGWPAGIAAAFGAYFGFTLLGKKMTLAGFVISAVASLILLFAGMYFSLVLEAYNALSPMDVSLLEAFRMVPYLWENDETRLTIIHDIWFPIVMYFLSVSMCGAIFYGNNKIKYRIVKLT